MPARLFIGNLSYQATEKDLMELFSDYGVVESATIILDKETGKSRGFGFVTMAAQDEANRAKEALVGFGLYGRRVVIDDARPREQR
jgi:cold-inducible RNA-binding protein